MKILTLLFCVTAVSATVWASHTSDTKEHYIPGLPPFCCDERDCKKAEVRILRREGGFTYVEADGEEWKVLGQFSTGEDGIWISPGKDEYICPIVKGMARCALVNPGGIS